MNRIVLIGNGFDLAHGLKTSYADFINWYWEKKIRELKNENTSTLDDGICCFKLLEYESWKKFWIHKNLSLVKKEDLLDAFKNNRNLVEMKVGVFFNIIQEQYEKKGWVDIENEYYRLLTEKRLPAGALNSELDKIKQKLITYLDEVTKGRSVTVQNLRFIFFEPFKKEDIAVKSFETFRSIIHTRSYYNDSILSDLIKEYENYNISHVKEFKQKGGGIKDLETNNDFPEELLLPDRIMLLNFNYTKIADTYFPPKSDKFIVNHIHGYLSSPNDVIFGYGDEQDESFKGLQKRNDKESLKNIKSIKYLETPNYRKLLAFMESAPYQIYIMGHSCGKSDGTLLNTLFEHKNCISIKPYYYQKADGTDNYMEMVQNISRNFTDMQLMRDRVVNKTQCKPLPQAKK
jgi:hypothetical protein